MISKSGQGRGGATVPRDHHKGEEDQDNLDDRKDPRRPKEHSPPPTQGSASCLPAQESTNRPPFAPALQPILDSGTQALAVAALAWLAR